MAVIINIDTLVALDQEIYGDNFISDEQFCDVSFKMWYYSQTVGDIGLLDIWYCYIRKNFKYSNGMSLVEHVSTSGTQSVSHCYYFQLLVTQHQKQLGVQCLAQRHFNMVP